MMVVLLQPAWVWLFGLLLSGALLRLAWPGGAAGRAALILRGTGFVALAQGLAAGIALSITALDSRADAGCLIGAGGYAANALVALCATGLLAGVLLFARRFGRQSALRFARFLLAEMALTGVAFLIHVRSLTYCMADI